MPALIELERASKQFQHRSGGWVQAVDEISLTIEAGRTLSLVGESGCGKSTTARLILGLESPSAGRVLFQGEDLATLDRQRRRHYRASVQAVFQDPWSSLSPRMRVSSIVGEPLEIGGTLPKAAQRARVAELLTQVGLSARDAGLYPHEFSGGQRQRIALARALGPDPRLIVLDEPVSALDLSIRAQIVNLLKDVQESRGLGYLMISHDLLTVWVMSDVVAVMYLGRIVELAACDELRSHPLHPYSQALIAAGLPAAPGAADAPDDDAILTGEVPSPLNPPSGCRFHTRCPRAMARCAAEAPSFRELSPGHWAACHLY